MSKELNKSKSKIDSYKQFIHRMIEEMSDEEDIKTISNITQRRWLEQKRCEITKKGEVILMLNDLELSIEQLTLISYYIKHIETFKESMDCVKKARILKMLNDLDEIKKINTIYQFTMGVWGRR